MPLSSPSRVSLVPAKQQSPGSIRDLGAKFRGAKGPEAPRWSAVGDLASNVQSQLDFLFRALQSPIPLPDPIQILDPSGNLVASIGHTIDPSTNASYPGGYFDILYVGGDGPASAPFFSNGEMVVIGENGQVYVLDPYSNIGAWLGSQTESPQTVTGAADNGSGVIRLTVTAHGYVSGDQVNVSGVGGVPAATGQWVISVFDADHFDLLGSVWAGTFTTGGSANRFYGGGAFATVAVAAAQRIEDIQDSGSGEARVTITGHGYATGYSVVLTGVIGVPDMGGRSWTVTVIDPDTFDLDGSVFSGSYVSGGLSLNWPTAKFIARADGSLAITNAKITLISSLGSIVLDPTSVPPSIVATDFTTGNTLSIEAANGIIQSSGGTDAPFPQTQWALDQFSFRNSDGDTILELRSDTGATESGQITLLAPDTGSGVTSIALNPANSSALVLSGPNGGAKFSQSVRVGGTSVPAYPLDATGDINTSTGYRVGGAAGLSVTRNMVASVATSATGVFGTPGVGQSNGQVVTGVTLTATTFSGGIITA